MPLAEEMPVVMEEVAVIVDTDAPVLVEIETRVATAEEMPVVPAKMPVPAREKLFILLAKVVPVMRKAGMQERVVSLQTALGSMSPRVGKKKGVAPFEVAGRRGRGHQGRSRYQCRE